MSKTQCSHSRFSWGLRRQCSNPAKVERDGEPFCGFHDPVRLRAIRDKNDEKRLREQDQREAERVAHKARVRQAAKDVLVKCFQNEGFCRREPDGHYTVDGVFDLDAAVDAVINAIMTTR